MAFIEKRIGKNKTTYRAQVRIKGYKTVCKTFDKYSKALEWAQKIEVQMKEGTYKEVSEHDINNNSKKFVYCQELIDYFKEKIAPERYSYYEKYTTIYEWWKARIGNVKIKDLTSSMLASCKVSLMAEKIHIGESIKNRSNNTINKYLMGLSAILTFAVKELEIIETNPMSKVGIMKKPDGRTRFLSEQEIEIFAEACKKHSLVTFIFFLLLISTGGRYSEVLHLQVENIDKKNSRIHFLNTKNKTNRGIGIDERLLELINNYLKDNNIESGYIFINPKTNKFIYMRGILIKIIKDVGLEDFHIHDIRHTFASRSAVNGASLLDIAILLGHRSLVMAKRYSHLTQQHTDSVARNTAQSFNLY